METVEQKKIVKSQPKKSNFSSLRVSVEIRKLFKSELAKINRGGFKVKPGNLLAKLLPRLTPEDIKELQEQSLSSKQRIERAHKAYCTEHGPISLNEFLDIRVNGKRSDLRTENAANSLEKK